MDESEKMELVKRHFNLFTVHLKILLELDKNKDFENPEKFLVYAVDTFSEIYNDNEKMCDLFNRIKSK